MNLSNQDMDKNNSQIIDFDIEDIPFKPINEGLGFHHGKKPRKTTIQATEISVDDPTLKNFNKVIGREKEKSVPLELEAFYKKGAETEVPKVNREIDVKATKETVSLFRRFLSYSIDISVSALILSTILSSMIMISGIAPKDFINATLSDSNYRYLIVLFIFIHLIYRVTSVYRPTLGQHLCKVAPKYSNEVAFNTIIEKTLLEFLSIPLLGLPFIFGLDKKLFGNNLKKRK